MDGEESVIVGAADADIVAQTARVGSGVVALGLLQQQRRLVQRGSFVLVPGDDDLFVVLQPALTVKKKQKKNDSNSLEAGQSEKKCPSSALSSIIGR